MIQVEKSSLNGVLFITPDVFEDFRGQYVELYNEALYKEKGVPPTFVQDDISVSRKNVLRGLHGDTYTWKLISCLYGALYFVAVNCNRTSPDFGKWVGTTLSARNRRQALVPPHFGNGHLILTDEAIFHYKQSSYFEGTDKQFSHRWNDPRLNIFWPVKDPILSERDAHAPLIA
ncbi:MAG: dTDP-4-dehydrorhamnose 3,5-epimerase [bacterium]|nr:dTDP-4-dehydrorhamnose 3,5-epimerase [bacterium]